MRIVSFVLCAVAIASIQGTAAHSIAFVGGTVIDVSAFGTGRSDLRDSVVVVEDGRITAVGPRRTTKIARGAEVIDAKGKFIVPGLHDVFATIDNQAFANAFLYMGVTAIVANEAPSTRRDGLYLSGSPSPRVYRMASVQGYDNTGLTPAPRNIGELMTRGRKMDAAELSKRVDELASNGVKVLLLHYSVLPDQLRAVAAHAREIGLATIGELGATTYPEAIAAGVRAFVHTSRYSLELAPPDLRAQIVAAPFGPPRIPYDEYLTSVKEDDPALARYATTLATSGVMLIPTLSLSYLDLPGHRNPWTDPVAALLNPAALNLPADPKTGERPVPANGSR